jgi:class 3 adenylate cyclase
VKCPKCQCDNEPGSKFCLECGAKLELKCPQCGKPLPVSAKFCNECGHDLSKPTEAPPIDYSEPQSYTPKFLAEKILITRSAIEGERKLVTVLFADVANYTSIAEKLDPEEVHQTMDGCFKILMDEIHKYEGTINQFTGDGVMALFGAPVAHEDHAQRGCYAALSIQQAMGEYGERIEEDRGVAFKMRIGLNSGPVIVGSIGDDLRMDYTAVGDTTNLASRMESMASPSSILVSGDSYRITRDFFEFEPLGKVQVKGREEALEAYELLKASDVETRIEAAAVKGLTRFVGRKNSMAALKQALELAESGAGQVVGLVGEAGVGKSRLLLEVRRRLPQDEFTYLEGRCLHFGGTMAYLSVLDILRSYLEIKEGDREFVIKKKMADKIAGLDEGLLGCLPCFHELLSLKVDDEEYLELEPRQKRERTFEGIRDLLIRESQERTLLLAIEDLHWIDKTSEEFLDYLIDWLANAKILLILLYRPEYTHHWGGKSYYNRIGLTQLTPQSSAELVQAILEGGEVVPELRELILDRAGGNPLFMEEFTHTLVENGSIEKTNHRYALSIKASDIQVPDTIQGIIAARMDRLEDNLKRTMQVASVIGRDFAFRILQTITGMREELKSHLLNLQGLEFVYEKSLFPELEYIFKHALTQEVAYNSLLLKRRKEIHERIGQAIEQIYAERLQEFYEMLAYHYAKSENLEKTYQYMKLSGEKSMRSYSTWEAFRFYREAINALNRMPETERNKREQIELCLLLSIPMLLLGYPENSLQILQEGEKHAKAAGDERSLSIFYSKLGHYHAIKGDPLLAIDYTENCFQQAGKYLKVVDVVPKILALLERTQRERDFFGTRYNVYSGLCGYLGLSYAMLGDFEQAKAFLDKGLHFALDINKPYGLGWLELCYGNLFLVMGDGRNVIEHYKKSIKYQEEAQTVFMLGIAWGGLGFGYDLSGDLETAKEYTEKGLRIHGDAGLPYYLSYLFLLRSLVHFDSGDLKTAQSYVKEALTLAQNKKERHIEGISEIWLGRMLGKTETSTPRGEEHISRGIEILEELKLRPYQAQGYFFLGELEADIDQREKALEHLKKAEAEFKEMGMDYWLGHTREVLGRV